MRCYEDGKKNRKPFETMDVSIIEDPRKPFSKLLLLSDSSGYPSTIGLAGAPAWLLRVPTTDHRDVQPSFAEHSVCIKDTNE